MGSGVEASLTLGKQFYESQSTVGLNVSVLYGPLRFCLRFEPVCDKEQLQQALLKITTNIIITMTKQHKL